jgi:poly(3-hydroxybutyrate) depolymerase
LRNPALFIALCAIAACRPAPSDTGPAHDTAATDPPPAGASAGCSDDAAAPTSGIYTVDDQGIARTYQLFVPSSYRQDTPAPLVAVFHGWGGDEDEFLGSEAVRAESEARGYVVVAPRGLGSGPPDQSYRSWSFSGSTTGLTPSGSPICDPPATPDYSYPSCNEGSPPVAQNTCSWTHCQADDVAFALALIEHVGREVCVDTARVFATGGSNGGMFTWELGQRTVDAPVFAAIAPVIGLPHEGYLDANPDLPVMLTTGTKDSTVPPGEWEDPSPTTTTDGDVFHYTGATAITQAWASARGCDTTVSAAPFDDGESLTDCRSYCPVDAGWPAVLDCRVEMGHTYGLSWSWTLTLDFFDAHSP